MDLRSPVDMRFRLATKRKCKSLQENLILITLVDEHIFNVL